MTGQLSGEAALTAVLVGNPNTGKSTLFNRLTGKRQDTGNYPGVTVAKKTGELRIGQRSWTLVDLPGSYSLVPRSPDELITARALAGTLPSVQPDLVLCFLDASNLRRKSVFDFPGVGVRSAHFGGGDQGRSLDEPGRIA